MYASYVWHACVTIHHFTVKRHASAAGKWQVCVPSHPSVFVCSAKAAPKCLPWIPGIETVLYCTQRCMNTGLAETSFLSHGCKSLIALVLPLLYYEQIKEMLASVFFKILHTSREQYDFIIWNLNFEATTSVNMSLKVILVLVSLLTLQLLQ